MTKATNDAAKIREKFGIPDWRDEAAYPTPDEMEPIEMWRWEFLRRNPNYREDFFKDDEEFEVSKDLYFERRYKLQWIADPRVSAREYNDGYTGDCPVEDLPLLGKPIFEDWVHFRDSSAFDVNKPYAYAGEMSQESALLKTAHEDHLFFRIDLLRPLGPQLERIKEIANNEYDRLWKPQRGGEKCSHARDPKRRPDKWVMYLRALDADDVGASYREILEAIEGHGRKEVQYIRDLEKAAQKLRDDWPY